MCSRLTIAVLLVSSIGTSLIKGSTLSPGSTLEATFISAVNTSDVLAFFTNDPLTLTGSPVITTELFNGLTLLGSNAGAPIRVDRYDYYQVFFVSPSSSFGTDVYPTTTTVVDLTSMQNGTVDGLLKVTVSGGSISGFNLSHFSLFDATSCGAGCDRPEGDLENENFMLTSSPEPGTVALLAIGLFVLAAGPWFTTNSYRQ